MQPARFVSFVVVAVLAAGTLAGCRQSPAVAAYVGDRAYTQQAVDEIFDEAKAAFEAGQATLSQAAAQAPGQPGDEPARPSLPITRRHVVNLLVAIDLGTRAAQSRNVPVAGERATGEVLASVLGIPADTRYIALYQDWYQISGTLYEAVQPVEVTEPGMMDVYGALVDANVIDPGLSPATVRQQFNDGAFASGPLSIADALRDEAEKVDTTVNPKYSPVAAPLIATASNMWFPYQMPYLEAETVVAAR